MVPRIICCCCPSHANDSPPGLPSLNMALVPELLVAPDMACCVVRSAKSGELVCDAVALFFTAGGAPTLLLGDIAAAFLLVPCETDLNKQYCVLATADGGPGAALGIVHFCAGYGLGTTLNLAIRTGLI